MAARKRGLGRHLEELLSGSQKTVELDTLTAQTVISDSDSTTRVEKIALNLIQPGRYQPRKTFNSDALQSLADSIKEQGIIQPVILRELDDGGYELIAGERRWRAAQLADLQAVPAIIQVISDETALAISLIENIQREDLNPIEKAEALQQLADEFHLTHNEIATKVGQSRTAITNTLRLLKLPTDIRLHIQQGQLEAGHGRALLTLDSDSQRRIVERIINEGLSVREVENLVQQQPLATAAKTSTRKSIDTEVQQLQTMLCERLNTKVQLQQNTKGKGKLIIHYRNNRELEAILEHIQ
ncbi:MAG: ParB/RepB/Spo0J family partition protein [Gammaproteobacteria bacterium]|nr:ParB/RepB/Spo0J family partition protein [Gammaproteobacteria bacterium]